MKRSESDCFNIYSSDRQAYITEANRKHREEAARLNALDIKCIFAVVPFCISIYAGIRLGRRRWKSVERRGRTSLVQSLGSAASLDSLYVAAALVASSNANKTTVVEATEKATLDKTKRLFSSHGSKPMPAPLKEERRVQETQDPL